MRLSAVTIIAIIAIFLTCCADPEVDRRLARAEALMMTAPDSALAILDSIDHAPLRGRRAALHALLLTHAHYRNYINDTDDSLITIAVDYFSGHDDPERLMTAYYCRGRVRDNAGRYPEAMTDALHALDLATARGDFFYEARAHELIGDLWFEAQSYQRAFDSFQKAGNAFKLAHRDDSHKWALASSACCLSNMGKYAAAISLLDSVNAVSAAYPALLWSNREAIMYACLLSGDLRRTETLLDSLFESGRGNVTANLFRLAQLKVLQGKVSEAKATYGKAMLMIGIGTDTTPDVMAQKINAEYLISTEGPDTADIVDVFNRCLSSLEKGGAKGVAEAESAYYAAKRQEAENNGKTVRHWLVVFILAALVSVSLLWVGLARKRARQLRRQREIETVVKELRDTLEKLDIAAHQREQLVKAQNETIEFLKAKMAGAEGNTSSLANELTVLNSFCDELSAHSDDNTRLKIGLFRKITTMVECMRNRRFTDKLAEKVNVSTGGLIERFDLQAEKVTYDDRLVFLYFAAGLSAKAIGVLMKIPTQTVYSKRTRLRGKIMKSNLTDKDDLLSVLS